MSLLISGLNILSEAEIGYKAARNKRLHVELALIKLCYLQQAIQLSAEGGTLSKKKLVAEAKSIAFRNITPFEFREAKVSAKNTRTDEAKLIIESPATKPAKPAESTLQQPAAAAPAQTPTAKVSALSKIRQQYKGNGSTDSSLLNQPIALEELQLAWSAYVVTLKAAKSPAVQPFELALLRVKDPNTFEAVTANNIEQKFIEQERNKLFGFLQEKLKNKQLQFSVIVEENEENKPVVEIPLNSTQQFLKMVEQYPLVKELKDRLHLHLDY